VPSGTAFFVKGGSATLSPTMTMKEIYKTTTGPKGSMFKTGNDYFRITFEKDELNKDEIVIAYHENASNNKDYMDAEKLYGPEVNLATITPDGKFLSINFKGYNGSTDSIPLSVGIANTGNYKFKFRGVAQLLNDATKPVGLVDRKTNRILDLRYVDAYDFYADVNDKTTWGNDRFFIKLGEFTGLNQPTWNEHISDYTVNYNNGELNIHKYLENNSVLGNQINIEIIDMSGRVVFRTSTNFNQKELNLSIPELPQGAYFLNLSGDAEGHKTNKFLAK